VLDETSSCSAELQGRLTLLSPSGANYDLYVYNPCGTMIGSSRVSTSATDTYVVHVPETPSTDNDTTIYVEIRYVSGASCTPWDLTVEGRNC
jgi:hypothetical protein